MNRKTIILSFLLFISLNSLSQTESESINISSLELKEVYETVKVYKDSLRITKDSLKRCELMQIEEKSTLLESSSLINVGKYYALIIAVQDYKNRNFSDLKYTIRDAESLQKVLLENYVFEDIYMCLNPTKSAIEREFQGLQTVADTNDNVLIFYAGHGYKWNKPRKNLTEGYWCPVDAEWESTSKIINNSQILYNLQVLDSRNTLLISDACFAGSIGDSRNVTPPQSAVLQEVYNIQSCQYISSGSNTTVPDESIFFKNLLKALTDNNEKYLKATDLFYNTDVKNSHTRSDGNIVIPACSPLMKAGHVKGGDFIFIKKTK